MRTFGHKTCQTLILYGIRKRGDDTKLELLMGSLAWNAQKRSFLELFLIYLL
jgi:hypothetical protein